MFVQPQNGTAVRIWDLFGDQGSQDWKQGRVAYYSTTPFTVSVLFIFTLSHEIFKILWHDQILCGKKIS